MTGALDAPAAENAWDAILLEGLSKRYRRPEQRWRRLLLPWSRIDLEAGDDDEDEDEDLDDDERHTGRGPKWALREISLTASPGEVLAVVGPPGSGKSTLLRVLAGLSTPTEGRAILRGRVGLTPQMARALFAGHWSARKNVLALARFMNVPRELACRQMENILTFAEVQSHRHLELRQWPGEMAARLAFSAVMYFEPDILLADGQVGAGGDGSFRRRCLEHVLQATKQRGLTVLLVTSDVRTVEYIAHRVIWLDAGRVRARGAPSEILPRYRATLVEARAAEVADGSLLLIRSAEMVDVSSNPGTPHAGAQGVCFHVHLGVQLPLAMVTCTLWLRTNGRKDRIEHQWRADMPGDYHVWCRVAPGWLTPGRWGARLAIRVAGLNGQRQTVYEDLVFNVGHEEGVVYDVEHGPLDELAAWWLRQEAEAGAEVDPA